MSVAPPTWPVADRVAFVDELFRFIEHTGASRYDEQVTQLEHARQCAAIARRAGDEEHAVCAALLHDIGHLLLHEHTENDDFLEHDHGHEHVGADWLSRMFIAPVCDPVRLHVPAKRYLCAVDASYAQRLSRASTRSLAVQGGPMSAAEVRHFEQLPGHRDAVTLRRRDEAAKVMGLDVPPMDAYRDAVLCCLANG